MKPLKTKVSITLDSDIITKVKVLAENDDRSFSQYINLVLKEHISSQSDQNAVCALWRSQMRFSTAAMRSRTAARI